MKVFTTFICLILQWEHCFLLHESYPTLTITGMFLHYPWSVSKKEMKRRQERFHKTVSLGSGKALIASSEDTKNKNNYLDENGIKSLRF